MILDTQEKRDEVKNIWLKHKDEIKAREIYEKYLGAYFDLPNPADWPVFVTMIRTWNQEIKKADRAREMESLDEEGIANIQLQNQRKMILLLRDLINDYETNPSKFKGIGEISNFYKTIQQLEEQIKRTEIQKGKLKLEAVRTLLPYQRLTLPELLELKEKFNESFDRIIRLKSAPESSAKPVGPTPVNAG